MATAFVVWAAASVGNVGCDYLAYDGAIRRFLDGGVLYVGPDDPVGRCGYFYYPPPFVLLVLPLTIFPPELAAWIATAALISALVLGIALMPVGRRTRWLVLLLAGVSWPAMQAIKLGQVGPLLFLVFALGWRWMDRPWRVGPLIALGASIKVQPILLVGWAFLTGRRRAVLTAALALVVLATAATVVTGPEAWLDQLNTLIGRSRPVYTEGLVTPGRIAVDFGLGELGGWIVELATWGVTGAAVVYTLVRCSPVASYMAIVVASQLLSPILWTHYALVLLLPVAWLIDRGGWYAAIIPVLSPLPLVFVIPPIVYPIEYLLTLGLIVWRGSKRDPEGRLREQGSPGPMLSSPSDRPHARIGS